MTYRDLVHAISKLARPTTLAALMNDLFDAEGNPRLTDREANSADYAVWTWLAVLRDLVGEREGDRLITATVNLAISRPIPSEPTADVRVVAN